MKKKKYKYSGLWAPSRDYALSELEAEAEKMHAFVTHQSERTGSILEYEAKSCSCTRVCCVCQKCRCCGASFLALGLCIVSPILLFFRVFTCVPFPRCIKVPATVRQAFGRPMESGNDPLQDDKGEHVNLVSKGGDEFEPPCEITGMPWKFPFETERPAIVFFGRDNIPCVAEDPPLDVFDPKKPTLLYVHGLAAGTVSRGFRETFFTPTGVSSPFLPFHTGNLWLELGYNIAIFYWSQFSDDTADATERKIYVGGPMKCALKRRDSGALYHRDIGASSSPGMAAQLAAELRRYFRSSQAAPVLVVGHSLGAQLALEVMSTLVCDERVARPFTPQNLGGSDRDFIEVEKLILLDPYFTRNKYSFAPMHGKSTATRAADSLQRLGRKQLEMETWVSSIIGEGYLGSSCTGSLREHTEYTNVSALDQILCWANAGVRHCLVRHIYLCTTFCEKKRSMKERDAKAGPAIGENKEGETNARMDTTTVCNDINV